MSSLRGDVVAIATTDGWLSILDPRNWSLPVATRVMSVFEGALVALTPDGDRVLTRDRDYTVRVWRTADLEGTVAFEPMNEDGMGFTGVARLSNGSERLVSRDYYGVVDMWCLPPP